MCGIFGFSSGKKNDCVRLYGPLVKKSIEWAKIRGQSATGLVTALDSEGHILKRALSPDDFLRSKDFSDYLKQVESRMDSSQSHLVLGLCRLATSGSIAIDELNQPIEVGDLVGVHNGILSAIDGHPLRFSEDETQPTNGHPPSDTHSLLSRFDVEIKKSASFFSAWESLQSKIEGSYSIAVLHKASHQLFFASNTGSLFYAFDEANQYFTIGSEKHLVQDMALAMGTEATINQVTPGASFVFDYKKLKMQSKEKSSPLISSEFKMKRYKISPEHLKRCQKCILPETYPFISFDGDGVCNFCRDYEKQIPFGEEKLLSLLDTYRSKTGEPDCLVGLSGGRDSCYGLYLLKKKYGMNPIAYTFDWGLTTEQSRRNQALICGKLGIEHIIRSPNHIRKRRFVRKNVQAWFEHPHLGMIPLFQAGDKEFYHYGRQLRKELGIDLTVLCSGYQLEQREFMIGFAGVKQPPVRNNHDFYYHPASTKAKLAARYVWQFLRNPRYLNEALFESLWSFVMSFIQKSNFLYLFHYLPWIETEVEKTLAELGWLADNQYGSNQWRMGDGQTAFNNYLYLRMAGFTEFDAFRSNQIREGLMTRDQALQKVADDNQPKLEMIRSFCQTIGLSFEEVITDIEKLPRLY